MYGEAFEDTEERGKELAESKSETHCRMKSTRSHQSVKEGRKADDKEEGEGYIGFASRYVCFSRSFFNETIPSELVGEFQTARR